MTEINATVTMTKRLEFDYGHRLVNHHGKCANLHGHRGVVEVTCELPSKGVDNETGMVIDFGDVKAVFGAWIDEHLDHTFIANDRDPLLALIKYGSSPTHDTNDRAGLLAESLSGMQKKPLYVVPWEPTSENIAAHLLSKAVELLDPRGVRVVSVKFYETPTSAATAVRV